MPASTPPIELGRAEEWAATICRGAPPFERLRHDAFEARHGGDPEEARRWIATSCGDLGGDEAQVLAALGLDREAVERAFAPAALVAGERLPIWAESLVHLVQALPQEPPPSRPGQDSVAVATGAVLGPAAELAAASRAELDAEALGGLAAQLATRMLITCGTVLELENLTRAEPLWDFSRNAWLERLHGFPGLSFVLGTAIRQWRQNALELLLRLRRDLPLIEARLLGGAKAGPLVAIDPDLGDRHNDGRSVAVLSFASGFRVVYKPKDQRSAVAFTNLVELLNGASPSLSLPAPRILDRGAYSWEDYVEQRQATTAAEASRFFHRFGMTLRLLQLVEGRDFWIDNLRVAGDTPVFIDLECVMQPRIEGSGFQIDLPNLDPHIHEESVMPTGAVTQAINVAGVGRQDFGALAPPGPRALPLGMWSGYHDRDNGNIWLRSGRLFWEPDATWPQLEGRPAEPVDHLEELEAGFREMQGLLCRSADAISSPQGPLRDIGEAPVRVIMRSTWEYLVLLRASLEPSALLDGNARDLVLANVPASTHKWGDATAVERRATIARAELDALRNLDIPVFHSLPGERALLGPGMRMPEFFAGTALERLRERVESTASFELDVHLEILSLAVRSIPERTQRIEPVEAIDRAR